MDIISIVRLKRFCFAVSLCLTMSGAMAQESSTATTVLGPTNQDLHDGSQALLARNPEEGVRLTLRGLRYESDRRNRLVAKSNLCAGYIMLRQYETGVKYCDEVLEENDKYWRAYSNRALGLIELERYEEADQDLLKAEALAPNSRNVKIARSMLLDKTDPVAPSIIIDDRRQPANRDDD